MISATDTITLQGTTISTSRVGFGCARLMRLTSANDRQRLLATAFDEGVRHFDVARMYGYGAAEGELGYFLRGKRSQITVATKFGIEPRRSVARLTAVQTVGRRLVRRLPLMRSVLRRSSRLVYAPKDFSRKAAEASLNASLSELRTDYVDIFFLHEPTRDDTFCEDLHAFLDAAREAGKLRSIGLSGNLDDILWVSAKLKLKAPVLQFASNVLKCDAMRLEPDDPRPTLVFGAIEPALDAVLKAVLRSGAGRVSLEHSMGGASIGRGAVARLLFWHAIRQNPRGVTLFSSGTPERLRELLTSGIDDATTELFANIVRQERKP